MDDAGGMEERERERDRREREEGAIHGNFTSQLADRHPLQHDSHCHCQDSVGLVRRKLDRGRLVRKAQALHAPPTSHLPQPHGAVVTTCIHSPQYLSVRLV